VAWQNERTNRDLDSPEHRRTLDPPGHPPIAPLQFEDVSMPQAPVSSGNPDPDDPFVLPPAPIHFNGHQYQHLPQHLAQQLNNLPALAPTCGHGRGQLPPVSE
jgi:hypothetical protein